MASGGMNLGGVSAEEGGKQVAGGEAEMGKPR